MYRLLLRIGRKDSPMQSCALFLLLLALAILFAQTASAQQVEKTQPASPRLTINLSAGMPGQSQWLYVKDQDSSSVTAPTFASTSYNDSSWLPVGIPYSANLLTSFLNADSGGGDGDLNGTINWYRLHFKLASQYAGDKILVEFEGAHTGAQVFVNGTLLPGISAVAANAQASHVIGFIPFIVDLTPYVHADGTTDNVLAVRVARNSSWFEQPQFSQDYRFGQADAGLFRPAYMFITNKVHIPSNVYSNQKTWGTYVATVSEIPSINSTATAQAAVVQVETNVLNEGTTSQQVTLTTQIVDANGNVVATAPPISQAVAPMTPGSFPSTATPMFNQQITINNPTLWYPNNSTYGTPYLYRVYHIVSVNGVVVDAAQSNLGIRTITWDHNFPYFNGHPMFLWGGSGRYDYPALGSSVPEEQQWRDLQQIAAEGGNIWRPGHSSSSEEFVNAADEYGVMIVQPSGDGEGAFASAAADTITLKEELHRDMIVRDRSHPSILSWEANNGTMAESVGEALNAIATTWDPINTRVEADRTPDPVNGYILGCTLEGCEVGIKNQYPNNPAWGSEYWGNGTGRGLGWDYELAFAAPFLDNWRQGRAANAFGMAQWYFADSPGEDSLYVEFNGDTSKQSTVRSLGASSVDMNRFPKLLYYIYQAAWTPYSIKPVVHLAHHWNRTSNITVNAFSNCPSVRLLINGTPQGSDQVPNSWDSNSSSNLTQTTTLMPFQVHWNVTWQSGTVTAECLDSFGNIQATDSRTTAGTADHIQLTVIPELTKPDGTAFAITANGSDAAFVTAQVVDVNGNVVPTAPNNIQFSVSGPATYMGGSEQYVSTATDAYSTAHSELNYHAPGDPELQAEGGMTKIALRSQFTVGTVTVTAASSGLKSGTASYTIVAPPSATTTSAPAIILPPSNTAVTVGQTATFSVTAGGTTPLAFQWAKNGAAISGATGSTYTTPATASADNNTGYAVTVTNGLGSVTSSAAVLTVDAAQAVSIATQPTSQTAYVGQTVTLTVGATGSPTLAYQWRKNGTSISGATSSTYTTPVLTSADNGDSFTVVVTNPVNSVTSSSAVLTVNAAVAPVITQQPQSVSVLANNPATFSVNVSGSAPFTYQWQLNGSNLLGANQSTYSIANVEQTNVGTYTVIASNAAGSVTSAGATLTIAPPGVNLALNKPATASSYQDSANMPASAAFDGNLNTRWASAGGVDPSWIQVDLGSVQSFDNVILYWEAAYASVYEIRYSTDGTTWNVAYTNNDGVGGVENLTFPTVAGRYVQMYGQQRATTYGYSLYEMQIYNIAQCGGSGERYTVLGTTLVKDNQSGLTWRRAETTYANGGAQYTQPIAQSYCSSQSMRLPTESEALAISGASSAACAFPNQWNSWTSTPDPSNSADAAFVTSTGQATYQVAANYPGAVLCTEGTSTTTLTITVQPTSQSVAVGQTATFCVVASGTGTLTYQWYKNGAAISGAIKSSYTTPATTATDNGASFYVIVTDSTGKTATSTSATLTVSSGTPTLAISTQPTAQSVALGQSATFSVAASGTGSLTYQWYKNSTAISAATSSSYTTPAAVATDNGATYYVVVGDSTGKTVTSTAATLTVTGSTSDLVTINSGGPATGGFAADEYYSAGGTTTTTNVISVTGVANAAPEAIYQSERAGALNYTIPGLTAGVSYTVRLHFAEFYWTATGQRVFNVSINGAAALSNFDIIAAAGGANKAVVESFTAAANTSGQIVINFTAGSADQPKIDGIEVVGAVSSGTDVAALNSGGAATGNFSADADYSGGGTATSTNTITITGVANAAPQAVYQSERSGAMTYTIPGLTAGSSYGVRLHFAEFYWSATGQRIFNVTINGTAALTNFDIIAAAGVANKAVVENFTATANSSGQIVIAFSAGSADQPKVSGIEIYSTAPPSGPTITKQPASTSVVIGQTATFSVGATGTGTLSYQWSKNGTTISGATAANYTTPVTVSTDNGASFTVKVTDSSGKSVTSSAATLTVTASTGDIVAVNSGGSATGSFSADADYSGGGTSTTTNAITTTGVTNAAPQAVYQSERAGSMTYTIPGLTSGKTYNVRLHFAEFYWTKTGQRIFNVSVNSKAFLSSFDIIAAAGAPSKAVVETTTATANSSGQIVIGFTAGSADQPKVSGIEVY